MKMNRMHTANRILALLLIALMVLSLAACGTKGGDKMDGMSSEPKNAEEAAAMHKELMAQENAILSENTALWEKVFMAADKGMTIQEDGKNYGDFLLKTIEDAKDQFTEEEYASLKADADKIREIENQIAALPQEDAASQSAAENSSTFPQFEGKDLDGNSVDSSLFANNAFTVVNFWFSGCKPCVDEMDDLDALNQRIKEQGGEVIGVNTETLDGNADNIATAKKILESAGASFRNIYFDPNGEAGKFALGIMAFPTTCVVDRQGNIVGEPIMGGIDQEANMATLEKLIAEAVANDTGK